MMIEPRHRWWLVFFVLILALIPFYFYGWVPLTEQVAMAEERASQAESELEHARQVHAQKDEIEDEISEIQQDMEQMDMQILEATFQPEFLVYLEETERAAEVSISGIDYGDVQNLEGVSGVLAQLHFAQVRVMLSGTYQQVQNFITEMEEGIWFTVSESFDFASSGDEIEGTYDFRVFFWPEISEPVVQPYLPDFPGTGRVEPFRSR